MIFPRSSGILLHPTSLPGRYGIGDLGEWAYHFVDFLEAAGQTIWQVLPLGPTSYGDSPYQCLSAFAGNPLLVSLDKLVERGWLDKQDVANVPDFPIYRVDFGWIIPYHNEMLARAYQRFAADKKSRAGFEAWCAQNAYWLDDYALFVALKNKHDGKPWVEWSPDEALRDSKTLTQARKALASEIAEQKFKQWLFFTQWMELKTYANEKNIRFIGDMPIFVAHDSSDVWANRHLYYLDESGNPIVIAGVPPDYFSETGQRWGNPLYRWDAMSKEGYHWWIQRFQATLQLVDVMRVDHFRGFQAYWEIPASEPTAIKGRWVEGPYFDLFKAVKAAMGDDLPIIAEDLGVITPEVEALRDGLGLPGMKVLQFAWSDPRNPFLPHEHVPNCVVYTGTHDNNTTLGWWMEEADDRTRQFVAEYVDHEVREPHWTFIRLGMMSVGHTFVAPLQDVLGYGSDTLMNKPGREQGNWGWRFDVNALKPDAQQRLLYLTRLYRRHPEQWGKVYGDPAMRSE